MQYYTSSDVYITGFGHFLPGEPVSNDDMEDVLGLVGGKRSAYKNRVLAANGIRSRHYAIGDDGRQSYLNQDMAAFAIEEALDNAGKELEDMEMLSVGSTMPDVLLPGFGPMVHGRLGGPPVDTASAQGICCAGAVALKHAWLAIRAGQHRCAVAAASELPSNFMRGERFDEESEIAPGREKGSTSYQYFNADFLRWMLSDGAGAMVLENAPRRDGLSLRVDWIEHLSYANELEPCMYLGTSRSDDVAVGNTWITRGTIAAAEAEGMLLLRQNPFLLQKNIREVVRRAVATLKERGFMPEGDQIDHFLPHLSSYFFADELARAHRDAGVPIPEDRWFTNLASKGNTGSASIYIILEEAFNAGRFSPGDRILCMIPESGRFSVCYAMLTCVAPTA